MNKFNYEDNFNVNYSERFNYDGFKDVLPKDENLPYAHAVVVPSTKEGMEYLANRYLPALAFIIASIKLDIYFFEGKDYTIMECYDGEGIQITGKPLTLKKVDHNAFEGLI